MLNRQVGAAKITRVVEMLTSFPGGSHFSKVTPETLKASPRLFVHFAKWADQLIPVIGTKYTAPTVEHIKRNDAAYWFKV